MLPPLRLPGVGVGVAGACGGDADVAMTRTIYTYFRGGGGVEVGAHNAGYVSLGGVEFDPAIAAVCDLNFPDAKTTVMDVCAVEPGLLLDAAPTWFHASPSCKQASQAKAQEKDEDGQPVPRETEADRAAGRAVARFITHWTPPMVTIENVWQYRTFEAFEEIRGALRDAGYSYEYWHLNSADYGVAQTRKRLILVARLGLRFIQRPNPTHRQGGDMFLPAWNGWYGAIADLIPTLPDSQFAPWQLARLPEHLAETAMLWNMDQTMRDLTLRGADQPVPTIDTGMMRRPSSIPQAFIVAQGCYGDDLVIAQHDTPTFTVTSNSNQNNVKAWLVGEDSKMGMVSYDQPAMTTVSSHRAGNTRAFLVDGQTNAEATGVTIPDRDAPSFTVAASATHRPARAWLGQGRVVKMTARALARFQSLPDTYTLPDRASLACTVIGNMVCPDLAEKIAESQP